jgi:hypothetical protein
VERIAAGHFDAPNSNGLQEHVFSVYKNINSALRQNLGNAKFEMLLILRVQQTIYQRHGNQKPIHDRQPDHVIEVGGERNRGGCEHHQVL